MSAFDTDKKNNEYKEKYLNIEDIKLGTFITEDLMPEKYFEKACHGGTLEEVRYTVAIKGSNTIKHAMVYLPYGYNEDEKYDVLYLMHGRGGRYKSWLGDELEPRPFKMLLDNMIEMGDIRPLIVVTPGLSYRFGDKPAKARDEASDYAVMNGTAREICDILIPLIDEKYSTYGDREHRGMAGFSMGGSLTWHMLMDHTDKFYYYIPMSMALYYDSGGYSPEKSKAAAAGLDRKLQENGYKPDDYKVFVASGDEDHKSEATYHMVKDLIENSSEFIYADSKFENGNILFNIWSGRWHRYTQSFPYLYKGLKKFFPVQK